MIRSSLLILAIVLIFSGCAYQGAVYSEYTHYGLGIRSAVEEASPINVEVGYGRGVYALVPKREAGSSQGEAASLISKNDLSSHVSPTLTDPETNETLLQVDAQFISGAAAVAAVMPENTVLMINSAAGAKDTEAQLRNIEVDVQGQPGQRLSAAFSPSARFTKPGQEDLQKLLDQINKRPEDKAEAIYRQAGTDVSPEFTTLFNDLVNQGLSNRSAFNAAKNKYIVNQPDGDTRRQEMISALQRALQ